MFPRKWSMEYNTMEYYSNIPFYYAYVKQFMMYPEPSEPFTTQKYSIFRTSFNSNMYK